MSSKRKLHWDKKIRTFSGNLSANVQVNTIVYTANEAGLLASLRINGTFSDSNATNDSLCGWAIVIAREGYSPNALNLTNGDFYIPEQDVLCCGVGNSVQQNGRWLYEFSATPKTKRKMQEGDNVYLVTMTTQLSTLVANIQLFFGQ